MLFEIAPSRLFAKLSTIFWKISNGYCESAVQFEPGAFETTTSLLRTTEPWELGLGTEVRFWSQFHNFFEVENLQCFRPLEFTGAGQILMPRSLFE